MAVLNVDPAEETVHHAVRCADRPPLLTTFRDLAFGALPPDVREEECTVAILFRGSLILNFVTGGAPDMTFSARCHRSLLTCRTVPGRAAWRSMIAVIDVACASLRGETDHCATAWDNHRARGAGRGRA